MSKSHRTCLECGARLAEAAVQCDLCGSPIEGQEAVGAAEPAPTPEAASAAVPESSPEPEGTMPESAPPEAATAEAPATPPASTAGVYCNQCGWKNPPGARFCSACGAALQVVAVTPVDDGPTMPEATPATSQAAAPEAPQMPQDAPPVAPPAQAVAERKAVSRQVGIIIGAGLLLVVVLFLVTAVSKTRPDPAPIQPAEQAPPVTATDTPPLTGQLAEQAAAIENELAQLTGPARVARQRDLVALFFSAGRLDRAATQQQTIAQATNEMEDWKRAGDLLYDWMNTIQDGARKAQVAGQAIQAYETVLETDPDNLDVRTDMATAYLNTGSPMLGVTEIKRVLEADPNHLHARFNYGIMLTWIQRPDQAVEQFEHVKSLVEETSTYYQRADEAIRVIREGGNL